MGLLRHSAVDKRITIAFDSREKELTLTVNRNEIKQVILNLVKNSFEAMPGGGEIRTLDVREEGEDGQARIVFTDTGPGDTGREPQQRVHSFLLHQKGQGG